MNLKTAAVSIFFSMIFLKLLGQSYTIKCFRCQVTPIYRQDSNASTPICAKFDYSSDFVVDCPYSTMCLKKIHRLELQNGQIVETITRDCANQKYTDQVFERGAWRPKNKVEEPYQEACQNLQENNLSASTTTYCHCRGKLCNKASRDGFGYHTDTMAVICIFNIMKYLQGN